MPVSDAMVEAAWRAYQAFGWSTPDGMRAALEAALSLPQGAPDGWKLVPIEMTDEMMDAFAEAGTDAREAARADQHAKGIPHPNALAECQWVPAAYRALLSASPDPEGL